MLASTAPLPAQGRSARLFLGLWPSAQDAAAMMAWVHDAHAAFGGRMMQPDTLHLTLAFLGSASAEQVDALVRAVPGWPAPVGPLSLQRFGRFAGPRIVWAGPGANDTDRVGWLEQLHDSLWSRLEPMGWVRPEANFRPHVSLLRKAGPGDTAALHRPALIWTPAQCVLVASRPADSGSRYDVLARMPLQLAQR